MISWWKWWVAVAAVLVAAYSAAGFWLVPRVIKNQVPKFGQTELARQATVGEVSFNPYTLRLEAQDLRLAEADGAPLLAIGKLVVELQWKSLVRRAWTFAEIRVTAPIASLAIARDGKFNLAELLATLNRRPGEASADTSLPRVIVGQFALEQGQLELRDRQAGYANTFSAIDFALTNFSTLPDQLDTYTFSADLARGGKLRWKGEASVNPIRGSGELILENAPLLELAVYLKSHTRATLAAGQLSATLPYRFSYSDGKLEAGVTSARLALRDLALAREGASDSFATLPHLDMNDISADLLRRDVTVGELRADGGKLTVRRDPKGELDLANLMVTAAGPAVVPSAGKPVVINDWKLAVTQMALNQMAISAVDETVIPPLKLSADNLQLRLQLTAEQAGEEFKMTVADAAFSLADLTLASGAQTPFKLAQFGFTDGTLDLAARRASLGRIYAEGGQLRLARDRKGQLDILDLLPKPSPAGAQVRAPTAPAVAPWIAVAKNVELSKFGAEVNDQATGVAIHVHDLRVKLEGASSDLKQPAKFNVGLNVREGGQLSMQGSVVPDSGALEANVRVRQLEMAPLQPLLSKYVKLKIAGGSVSARGRLTTSPGSVKSARLRYVGDFDIAGLTLKEESGEPFAAWKSVGADKVTATLAPNLVEIPELRVVEPNAILIIENDRTFNAARLLVQPTASDAAIEAPSAQAPPTDDPFPVRIQRLRFQNGKLDFTDLSLRPQFGAKIYELNGVVTGLSSNRDARSQIELDGRVDEFGLARIRGELNPFAPRDNTDVNVVFKNVDMVPATPYSMKFAGYKIAEGKISLDLQYKVRNSQLEGTNQIVIDKLTLGERVESPDALKLPLELAIAILKDSDGRIDLGVPVSGNTNDPQFSYGAVIWKAIGNVLTKIVTAPFRALGGMFGMSGEKLEAIEFDPGSDRLLPPEREKLKQVAQVLSKRPQLKLSVPGQYSEAADGAALKSRAVRVEIARRTGIKLDSGEDPGPLDLRARTVRGALRDLYAERFGAAELDKQKKAAEERAVVHAGEPTTKDAKTAAEQEKLPLWQRAGLLIQGEPQVADASSFYHALQERLDQSQPLAAEALTELGAHRATAILAALRESGVDPGRALAAAPEKVSADVGKPVPLRLALATK